MDKAFENNEKLNKYAIDQMRKALKEYNGKNQSQIAKGLKINMNKYIKKIDYGKDITNLQVKVFNEFDRLIRYDKAIKMSDYAFWIDEMTNKTKEIYNNIPQNMVNEFRVFLRDVDKQLAAGEVTIQQATKAVSDNYNGTTIRYKNGSKVNIDDYLKMLYKTSLKNNNIVHSKLLADDLGTTVYEYSSHSKPRKACAPIQGQLVAFGWSGFVKDGDGNKHEVFDLYDYGYGTAAGAQGINCLHMLFPFVEGVSLLVGETKDIIKEMAT